MADEKLVIAVELDTSKAEAQAAGLKEDLTGASSATKETSEYSASIERSLTSIRNLNLNTLLVNTVSHFSQISSLVNGIAKYLSTVSITRIKSLGLSLAHLPELLKFRDGAFGVNTEEALANLGSIRVKGRRQIQGLFDDIRREMGLSVEDWNKYAKAISTALKVFVITAIIGVMKALTKLAIKVSELGDQIDKGSQKADMSASKYQEWGYIFDRCGLSADDLNTSMKMLQRNVANTVAQGKYAGSAYEKLGISMAEISNLKSDELFERTVQKLQSVGNQAERTAIAYEIFGRSATQLNTILNASNADIEKLKRTYDALGAKMGDDLVAASARLQDAMTDLKNAGQGLKNVVGQALIPSITKLVHWLAKAVAYITMFIRAINGFKSTGSTTKKNTTAMGGYAKAVDSATAAVEKLKRSQLGFDEMNILPSQDSGGAGDVGSALEDMDFGGLEDLSESLFTDEELAKMEEFQKKMDRLAEVMRYITPIALTLGGALMIVVGLMSGNLLMVVGGIALCGLGIAIGDANGLWDELTAAFQKHADVIQDICVMTAMAIGLVMALLSGNIPLAVACGVGLIAGLVSLGSDLGWWDAIFDALKSFWNKVKDWFNTHIKKVFTKEFWKQKWDNIVQGFKDGINNLITKLETGINNIINKINNSGAITAINKLFNWNLHIEPISIKRLATGGIVDRPTFSMIGENGAEAVVPLENNTQWMDKLADRLTAKTPTKIVLVVDGKELGYASINNINAITRETGNLQLKLA